MNAVDQAAAAMIHLPVILCGQRFPPNFANAAFARRLSSTRMEHDSDDGQRRAAPTTPTCPSHGDLREGRRGRSAPPVTTPTPTATRLAATETRWGTSREAPCSASMTVDHTPPGTYFPTRLAEQARRH